MITITNDDGTYLGEFFGTLAEAETRIGELEKELGGSFYTKEIDRNDPVFKAKQKELIIKTMQADEEAGLYGE